MTFTVLGAGGVIGRALVDKLHASSDAVHALGRSDVWDWGADWGDVIYAVGVTADFRSRPHDTVDAHVGLLSQVLQRARFRSLLYLSSTRVYNGAANTREDATLCVRPGDASDLYNLSKLLGESLCLAVAHPAIRVARLSNVVGGDDAGSPNFVADLRRQADAGCIRLSSAPESAKDYVHIDDVCELLVDVARGGRERIYNVASGINITHARWVAHLQSRTGCRVEVESGAPVLRWPPIDVARIRGEFGRMPRAVLNDDA